MSTGSHGVGRNEKCPCGSGKKFKQCCLGKGDLNQAKRLRHMWIAIGVVAALSVVVALVVSQQAGLILAVAGAVGVAVWLWMTAQPPKSGSGSNPSAINFGS